MKKLLFVAIGLFLLALVHSSCKSHETCPAYGKVDAKQSTEISS